MLKKAKALGYKKGILKVYKDKISSKQHITKCKI